MEYALKHPEDVKRAVEVQQSATESVKSAGGGHIMAGSAALAAGVGLAVVGPIGCVLGAAGGAYAATQKGPTGDIARASGECAVAAYNKQKELDKKYKITEKTTSAVKSGFNKAKQVNEKYNLTTKASSAAQATVAKAKHIDTQYHVSEKAGKATMGGIKKLTKALN